MRLRWQRKAPRTRSDRTQVQSQIKSRCHRSSLKRRDSTAYPTSVQINGATALLLQADMDWDKWHCSFSLCGGRRASMKFSSFHMMSISTSCSSHVSFERSSHTWTKFIQIQSAVQPMKMERIVGGLTQVFLSRRDWTASVVAKLKRAEINGFRAGRCVWRPPSLHEIFFFPYDVHLHFLLFTCFSWKILSYLNQIKFKTLCNLWKWKDLWVSHKFSCLVEIEQPLLLQSWNGLR